ncbi:MAG: alpha-ribazole phosphatase [Deltaproteobacteria bacterium]|nr:MAG: alpha-ribazole phosphatase [Deltaproteobacteria bacterium]
MIENMKRLNRVYLIRHGQIEGYEHFPIYGHTDVRLTETGLLQMQQAAERLRLAEIGAIYASDLQRAVMGARQIARYHDVPVRLLPELREMYFGAWEGLTLSEVGERFPRELEQRRADIVNFRSPGGGESVRDLFERVMTCYNRILKEQEGNDIAIVGHGAVNRVILCEALGLDPARIFNLQQDYGCLNIIDYFPDTTLVRLVNG